MLQSYIRAFLFSVPLILTVVAAPARAAPPDSLNVYIDADFSISPIVGESIELGLRTAFSETDGRVAGVPVSIRRLDHRTSPRRSHQNFAAFLRDPNAIVMIGGQQSPPYLSYGSEINASQVPLMLAWSAAAPVTRFAEGDANYIFRLSVDDKKAGPFLVGQALASGCRRIALILVDTGWGRANLQTMTAALEAQGVTPTINVMVPSDVGQADARNIARDIAKSSAKCSLSVLTNGPSAKIFEAMDEMRLDIDVYSHWAVFSPSFLERVPHATRQALNLRFVHTCGLSIEQSGSPTLNRALTQARNIDNRIISLADIGAPAGFVHGYDLGRILKTAADQASATPAWSLGPTERRVALRAALASLDQPVIGIMKTYAPPFSEITVANKDGHDALGAESLCLAKFDEDNRLVAAESR